MANGQNRVPTLKIDIPMNPDAVEQGLRGLSGQPQVGQNSVLAPQEPIPVSDGPNALTPAVSDIKSVQAQNIEEAQPPTPRPEPPPAPVAPSANLPDPVAAMQTDPRRQALIDQIDEQVQMSQDQRRGTVEQLQNALAAAEGRGPNRIAQLQKGLANFSDAFFDTSLSKNVAAPETQEQREARLNLLRRAISQEQGALSKAEIQRLQAALKGIDTSKLQAQLGRDRRFQQSQDKAFEFDFRKRRANVGKDLTKAGIPALEVTFSRLDNIIPGGLGNYNGGVIEGIGGAESLKTPNLLSDQGKENRRAATALGNQILKLRSGAQINEQEAARIMRELGFDVTLNDENKIIRTSFIGPQSTQLFVNGVQDAVDMVESTKDVIRLSHGEDAYEAVAPALRTTAEKRIRSKQKRKSKSKKAKSSGMTPQDIDKMSKEELEKFLGQ